MNIHKNIIKYVLTAGICLFGSMSFANTLSAVDVFKDGNGGKILLNISQKPVLKKMNVSENKMTLKLNKTDISSNLISKSSDANISIMQDGNSTFLTISGNNISDYKILNASDNSVIPTSSNNNSAIIISALLFLLSLGFMSFKKKEKLSVNKNSNVIKVSANIKSEAEKSMLNDLKTLRTRNQVSNSSSIHGNPVLRFSNNSVNSPVSVPEGLKSTIPFREKVSYMKTAVNS